MKKSKFVGAGPVSARTSKARQNKGITLIALVITIIVMLILVAVTISMAVNGGLFDYAGRAVSETQNAMDEEQKLADGGVKIDGTWYNSIDEYLGGDEHNWTRSGDTFTCSHCNAEYTMGEVVDYTDAGAASTTLTAAKSGLDKMESYPDYANVDASGNQTIEAQDATWIVLGIEDTDGDGKYETLLITTETDIPISVDDEGNKYGLTFYGAAAYNNGVDEINRICKELYSNSTYGNARGMTIEDVNAALNYTPLGGYYYNSGYKTTGNLTTKLKDIPTWDNIKGNYKTPDGTNTETAYGEYELNGYYYYLNDDATALANPVDSTTSEITAIERATIFGTNTDLVYWLASRGVYAYADFAFFGPGSVGNGGAVSYFDFFISYGVEGGGGAGLRPVVSLISELPTVKTVEPN